MTEELQLFVKWSEFLKWLLNTTEKFPKKVRFTFTTRIDNLALDILEDIIEFRYDKKARQSGFMKININSKSSGYFFGCATNCSISLRSSLNTQ